MHDHGIMCAQSVPNDQLMERTGLNRRGLARGRQQLVEAGIIEATQQDKNRNSSRWNYRFRPEILNPIGDGIEVRPDRPSTEKTEKQIDQPVQQVDKTVPLLDKAVQLQKALKSGKSVATTLVSEPENEDDSTDIRILNDSLILEGSEGETKSSNHDHRTRYGRFCGREKSKAEDLGENLDSDATFWLLISQSVEPNHWNPNMVEGRKLLIDDIYRLSVVRELYL